MTVDGAGALLRSYRTGVGAAPRRGRLRHLRHRLDACAQARNLAARRLLVQHALLRVASENGSRLAPSLLPAAIASSTERTAVRARDVRDLLTSVRRTAWRAAFFADFVLAIAWILSKTTLAGPGLAARATRRQMR